MCQYITAKLFCTEETNAILQINYTLVKKNIMGKKNIQKSPRGILHNNHYYAYKEIFSSVFQLCLTLCDPIDCNTPSLPVHHQLPEFTQTHVH